MRKSRLSASGATHPLSDRRLFIYTIASQLYTFFIEYIDLRIPYKNVRKVCKVNMLAEKFKSRPQSQINVIPSWTKQLNFHKVWTCQQI